MDKDRRLTLLESFERLTALPLLVLSVAVLPLLLVPIFVSLSEQMDTTFFALDWMIWAVFAADLSIRTYLSERRIPYLRDHWFDVLIVVLPFLRPLRVVRSVRAMRLLRLGPFLARSTMGARDLLRQRGLQWVILGGLLAVVGSATLVFGFERNSGGTIDDYGTAIWWAFTTMTTVGYGDAYPITPEGRAAAVFLMLIGISFFGWLTANIAAFLVEFGGNEEKVSMSDLMRKLESLEEQVQSLKAA